MSYDNAIPVSGNASNSAFAAFLTNSIYSLPRLHAEEDKVEEEYSPFEETTAEDSEWVLNGFPLAEPEQQPGSAPESNLQDWGRRAEDLAQWAQTRLVNRRDVWGQYREICERGPDGRNKALTLPEEANRGAVTLTYERLVAHFKGHNLSDLIGLHTTAAENTCLWIALDIDYHGDDPESPIVESNKSAAIWLFEKLRQMELHPLLTDTNGNGSFHILVLFNAPVRSDVAFNFAKRIKDFVLCAGVEAFPKQKRLDEGSFGNFLRLPGRHHTRNHWTKVYADGIWHEGNNAIERLLYAATDDPKLVEELARTEQTASHGPSVVPNPTESASRLKVILSKIPARRWDDYHDWIRIGMAVHHELPDSDGLNMWDAESKRSKKYKAGSCSQHWSTFNGNCNTPVRVGTLIHWIREENPSFDPPPSGSAAEGSNGSQIEILTWAERRCRNPNPQYQPELICGLLRAGEVMNIISGPKVGKSWIMMQLLLAVAAGMPWLGFETKKGKVLLIDGELHDKTIDQRMERVAAAVGVDPGAVAEDVKIASLRGSRTDIRGIEAHCNEILPGDYSLIILDPMYLLFLPGSSEANDHDVRELYLRIIVIARRTGAAVVVVHHTTKGNQATKGITDVGSGHGVISRIVDTHITLLPVATEGDTPPTVKLEAVTRSFKQPQPRLLVRAGGNVPVWTSRDYPMDATGGQSTEASETLEARRFAEFCAKPEEEKRRCILERRTKMVVNNKPLPGRSAAVLFDTAMEKGYIIKGSKKTLYRRSPDLLLAEALTKAPGPASSESQAKPAA